MAFNPQRTPDWILEPGQTIEFPADHAGTIAFVLRGAAGQDGSGEEGVSGTSGASGGRVSGVAEVGGLPVGIWCPDGTDGYYTAGNGPDLGGDGGGDAMLRADGAREADAAGGGGGGGWDDTDAATTDPGGGGGGAPGGLGGSGADNASDGGDAEGEGEGGDGGDGADASSTPSAGMDGGAGAQGSNILLAETSTGAIDTRQPEADLWFWADAGAPTPTIEFRGPETGVEISWPAYDCDGIRISRNGTNIADLAETQTSYIDGGAPVGESVDYAVSATYAGYEYEGSQTTIETTTTALSGTAEHDVSALENTTIVAINRDEGLVEAETTADSNGDYSLEVRPGYEYHVVAEYDDGETMYNATSYPFLNP